jgi:uncharacterized protein YndB with AHSA1/START domain
MATIRHKIRINAPKERVFEALSTTEGIRNWFTPRVDGVVAEGESATFRFPGGENFQWKFPQSLLHWECIDGPAAAPGTDVTFRIESGTDGQTRLELDHSGWPEGHSAMRSCNTLWGIALWHLKRYAETNRPAQAFN